MSPHLRSTKAVGDSSGSRWSGSSRAGSRFRSAVESGVLVGLLLAVVVSALTGNSVVLFYAVVGAWLALAVIVGPRNLLDAGCFFTLLVVGVIVVVDLATNGPSSLLP